MQLYWIKARFHVRAAWANGLRAMPSYMRTRMQGIREHNEFHRQLREGGVGADENQAFSLLAARYTPPPLRAAVVQFLPANRPKGGFLSGELGWGQAEYRVEVVEVPGDHRSMLL